MENHQLIIKKVKPGDRPSASEWNKLVDAVAPAPNKTKDHYAKVRLVSTADYIGRFNNGEGAGDRDRSAYRYHYAEATDEFAANSGDPGSINNIHDPFELVYDADEYLLLYYSEQSNKFYPINGRTVRHAITCRDSSNRYPKQSDHPDTYPIKFVKLSYAETIAGAGGGRNGHDLSYLRSDEASDESFTEEPPGEDRFVHNIVDNDLEDAFIPEGTLIEVYNVTRQWFTYTFALHEDSSVSKSDSSFSSSSTSSSDSSRSTSSSQSRSESSASSSGGSSSSSGGSSLSSSSGGSSLSSGGSSASSGGSSVSQSLSRSGSSRGSSASSVQANSSGGSSDISQSQMSDFDCVTVITSIAFNAATCELTFCTKRICFPEALGVVIDPEDC